MTTYKIKDLVGKKFGRLHVISFHKMSKHRKSLWNCMCDCGNTVIVTGNNLLTGNSLSCGCLSIEKISLAKGIASKNRVLHRYKENARKRGISFELSNETFFTITQMNCFYCGTPPFKTFESRNGGYIYNGIDRLNNTRGYINDNVVPCCKHCNFAKNTMSYQEFKYWISKVSDHMLSKDILFAG